MATFKWKGESYIVTQMWPEDGLFGNLDKVVQASFTPRHAGYVRDAFCYACV